ncbi:hypothetical protein AB0W85_000729 [Campylobacter jejuni]|nr:hypothetical protein [Campylobacter jejuni]EIF6437921.1 hypothetical protein [Campylobacter jejuni]EJG4450766.1 hypothetical protein [Campylobacter jejuni]EKT0417833.1 hypothetical protein [Campylobacter jejuni]ELQ3352065.1 hypothetical protein [Campylobacter jejuni]
MKKLGLALAALVVLNVSAFADLIVINKKRFSSSFSKRNAKQIFPRECKINFR